MLLYFSSCTYTLKNNEKFSRSTCLAKSMWQNIGVMFSSGFESESAAEMRSMVTHKAYKLPRALPPPTLAMFYVIKR